MKVQNEFGLAVWRHKTENLLATRSYSWCDTIIVTDESQGRLVISVSKFSEFDFTDWIEENGYV